MRDKFEFPNTLTPKYEKAKKLEWISITFFSVSTILMYLTMGNSQTMKTAWLEDLLSITPPVAFLIASKIYRKPHNKDFPFGYHRVVTIAYLVSALALLVVGIYLASESVIVLARNEHPTIGTVVILGKQIWLGYLMILALLFGTVPSIFLGIAKIPLAIDLHDKNLYTDAQMNKADWMTGVAAIVGILGIGLGMWWADAVAALIISLDVLHDGFKNLKQSVFDLMNQVPKTVDNSINDPLLKQIKEVLNQESWIKESRIRVREEGHIYFGEAFVVPKSEKNLLPNMSSTKEKITNLSWILYDFNIIPVESLTKRSK